MATADPTQQKPGVILVRCGDLRAPLVRTAHFRVAEVADLATLVRPGHGVDGQAIVVHRDAFESVASIADTVERLRRAFPLVDVIVWAPDAGADFVREALVAGVRDVLLTVSPDDAARAVATIIDAQQLMPRAATLGYEEERDSVFHGLLARSRRMWDLFDTASRIAPTEAPVLILGETGTGKELLARAVHRLSGRPGQFVPVNCAAIADSLVDSELFGHVKGAFTGAIRDKDGLFRHADRGTLLLDEVGRISLSVQHRLLRALQESAVRPVGAHEEIEVDVRIIAATSTALDDDVTKGRFREDLFYRLDVIHLEIPPLRERPEDIVFLFGHFARELARQYDLRRPDVSDGFLDALLEYEWPGNVRQLENFTERLLLTHTHGPLEAEELQRHLSFERYEPASAPAARHVVRLPGRDRGTLDTSQSLQETIEPHVRTLERSYIEACLTEERGRIGRVAERAGISRRTLLRKMKQYGLDKAEFKDEGRHLR